MDFKLNKYNLKNHYTPHKTQAQSAIAISESQQSRIQHNRASNSKTTIKKRTDKTRSTLFNQGSLRISVPRLCTMQGPGIAVDIARRRHWRKPDATDRATLHITLPRSKSKN
ncbi:hypothetical protein STAS_03021, partial [Striga asiatica]